MANGHRKLTNILRSKTLEEIEEWERVRPDMEPWKLGVVQQVKNEKRKPLMNWFRRHSDQLILVVIFGTVVAVVGGLIVAWITLPWKP